MLTSFPQILRDCDFSLSAIVSTSKMSSNALCSDARKCFTFLKSPSLPSVRDKEKAVVATSSRFYFDINAAAIVAAISTTIRSSHGGCTTEV